MPNWAYTQYKVTGDKKQVENLYGSMKNLGKMKSPGLVENDFGSTWFGNLIVKFSENWENIYCRGYWEDLRLKGGILYFSAESAWAELEEVRMFLEKIFTGIKIYYQTEEPGMGIYATNDRDQSYFYDKYILWVEDCHDTEYYETLGTLIEDVEKITHRKDLKSLEDCQWALEKYSEEKDKCYVLEEFKYEEDN